MTRHPPRARVHRPRPAREVRRALPRPLRRPARRGGLGARDVRAARLGRRARRRSPRSPSCCPTTTSTPCARPSPSTATASPPSSSRRPRRTWASCRPMPGFNRALVDARARERRAGHPRRGAHGLPRRRRPAGGDSSGVPRASTRPTCSRSARSSAAACPSPRSAAAPTSCSSSPRSGRCTRPAPSRGTRSRSPRASRPCEPRMPRSTRTSTRPPRRSAPPCSDALAAEGVAHGVQRAGNLFSFVFGDDVASGVRDYAGVQRQEAWRYPPFFHAMLDAGVSLPPSVFEAWFVTAAHDDDGHRPDRGRAARRSARRGIRSPGLSRAGGVPV